MRISVTLLFVLILVLAVRSQPQNQDVVDYVKKYKDIAVHEMVRVKVPASITLAQGILESGIGKSPLATTANNHFGIKCKDEWTGKKYYHDDDLPHECFRVYKDAQESYTDHSEFIMTRPRYELLFQLKMTDYKSWAYGLAAAGYATNPNYAALLINYIEDYKLSDYDQQAIAMLEEKPKGKPEPQVVVINAEPKHTETTITEAKRSTLVVNGLRCIKAVGNEDPFKIAFEYDIDYTSLMVFNDLTIGERFKDGEFVFLEGKKKKGADAAYRVVSGESMRDVAQTTGIKLKDLYKKNEMKPNDQVYPGEVLNLQGKRARAPRTMSYAEFLRKQSSYTASASIKVKPEPEATATITSEVPHLAAKNTLTEYRVQQSDTLYAIAKKFNTSVDELKALNNLETSALKPGMRLVVSK